MEKRQLLMRAPACGAVCTPAEFIGIANYDSEVALLDTSGALATAELFFDLTAITQDDLSKELQIPVNEGIVPLGGLAYR